MFLMKYIFEAYISECYLSSITDTKLFNRLIFISLLKRSYFSLTP